MISKIAFDKLFILVAVLMACPAAAQQSDDAELDHKLHGNWKADADRTAELLKELDQYDEDQLKELAGVKMQFTADNNFVMKVSDREMRGQWKSQAVPDRRDQLNITLVTAEGQNLNGVITFLPGDAIKIQPDDEMPAIFVKTNPATTAMNLDQVKRKLIAMWSGNPTATKSVNQALGVADDQIEIAVSRVGDMRLRIHKDNSYAFLVITEESGTNEMKGTWTLEPVEDEENKFAFIAETEGEQLQFTIWMENEDMLVFRLGDQPATVFKRNKPHEW